MGVGSLVVGLHDDSGHLHHCGVAASFTAQRRRELLDELETPRDGRPPRPSVARNGWTRPPITRAP